MNSLLKIKKAVTVVSIIIGSVFISNKLWASSFDTLTYVKTFDLIRIPVQIKGKTYNFIFDTGAQGTVLRSDKAAQMGIETGMSDTLYDAFNNKTIQPYYLVDQLFIGKSCVKNVNTQVFPTNALFECLEIDGAIGFDVMAQFDWLIDFDKQQLIKIDTIENKFQKNIAFKQLRLSVKNNIPTIKLLINNQNIDFLFDSGATMSDIDFASCQMFNNEFVSEVQCVSVTGGANSEEIKNKNSKITLYTQPASDADFKYLAQFNKTGITKNKIGNNFWNNNQVFFSFSKQILAYNPLHVRPRGSFGASFSLQDGNMIVASIVYNEQVKNANLQLGDKIKSINGNVFANKCELNSFSRNFNGAELVLEMMDGRKIRLTRL